jgi:hypothetical protein
MHACMYVFMYTYGMHPPPNMTYLQKRLEALNREVFLVERVVVDNLLLGFAHAPEKEDACHIYTHTQTLC